MYEDWGVWAQGEGGLRYKNWSDVFVVYREWSVVHPAENIILTAATAPSLTPAQHGRIILPAG